MSVIPMLIHKPQPPTLVSETCMPHSDEQNNLNKPGALKSIIKIKAKQIYKEQLAYIKQ